MLQALLIAAFGSAGLFSFIQYLFLRHDSHMEKKNLLGDALRAIIQLHLKDLTEDMIRKGRVKSDELEEITELFEIYEALGGNGFIKNNFETVKKLPRKE